MKAYKWPLESAPILISLKRCLATHQGTGCRLPKVGGYMGTGMSLSPNKRRACGQEYPCQIKPLDV